MSLQYIREMYQVPARRGERVTVITSKGQRLPGTITGSSNAYVRIRLDGEKRGRLYHPTQGIVYHKSA